MKELSKTTVKNPVKNFVSLVIIGLLAGLVTYLVTYQPTNEELLRTAIYRHISATDIERSFFATNGVTTFNAVVGTDFSNPAQSQTRGDYAITAGSSGDGIKNDFITDTQTTAIRLEDFSTGAGEPNPAVLGKWFYTVQNGQDVAQTTAFAYVDFINSPLGELPAGDLDGALRSEVLDLLMNAYEVELTTEEDFNGEQAVRYTMNINAEALLAANSAIADAFELVNIYEGQPQSFDYEQFDIVINRRTQEIELIEITQFGQQSFISFNYPAVVVDIPEEEITYEELTQKLFQTPAESSEPQA